MEQVREALDRDAQPVPQVLNGSPALLLLAHEAHRSRDELLARARVIVEGTLQLRARLHEGLQALLSSSRLQREVKRHLDVVRGDEILLRLRPGLLELGSRAGLAGQPLP